MTPNPICVPPETKVSDAVLLMLERGFRHLPLVAGQEDPGRVLGARRAAAGDRHGAQPGRVQRAGERRAGFEQLPTRVGMAFVVILHLSPKHESSAAEILQRATQLPVRQVSDATPIEVDHVYVIPPGVELTMDDGHLRATPSARVKGRHVTVDVFFRTLAEAHRQRAVCIVMSGTGSDGAVGLTRVKELGGVAMAQAPDDAAHDGMPLAAIGTGMVDIVLPAIDMGQRLIDLWSNARQIRMPDAAEVGAFVQPPQTQAAAELAEKALQDIMALLRTYTRPRLPALQARHRAAPHRAAAAGEPPAGPARLPRFPARPPRGGAPLLRDMLISVTSFFRDRDAFEALERDAMPGLVERRQPGEQVRAWVAGCATGEEAYSLSILLREQADLQHKPLDIQVFATDIDERAIATARKGVYAQGIVEDMSPARLRQFFVKDHDQYRVSTRCASRCCSPRTTCCATRRSRGSTSSAAATC
jgi:two-component system CheB/CheR fusion protein